MSMATRKAYSVYPLAFVALAAAGCSDNMGPTASDAPEAAPAPLTGSSAAAPRAAKVARTPYISDLPLQSIYVQKNHRDYDNPYDVVLTNPGGKASGLYLQSELRQELGTADGGGTIISCPTPDGSLSRGTPSMRWYITPPGVNLVLGPATLTLKLVQTRADNSLIVLDSRTVDVEIVPY